MTPEHSLDGTIITVPFDGDATVRTAIDQYRRLLDRYRPDELLVITGSPTSMETVRAQLADCVPGAAVPRVTSLVVHATDVLNRVDDRRILSDTVRRELLHRFLDGYEWNTEYLSRAAEQPSFHGDIAQFMETAAWQGIEFETTPELVEIGEAVEAFHAWLSEHELLERGQLLTEAVAVLDDPARRTEVVDAAAILVVEFEEFLPLDRRYLGALSADLDLVCVATTGASIRRSAVEPGTIVEHVNGERSESTVEASPSTRPAATATYLACGVVPDDPGVGAVNVLSATTREEQHQQVVNEIERLRDRYGWSYDDFAVGVNGAGTALTDAVRALQRAGIPTGSATVDGFGDDPAVREIVKFARLMSGEPDGRPDDRTDDVSAVGIDEATRSELTSMDGLLGPLERWITESGLKHRIATSVPPLDARTRFGNVRRAIGMAEFLERTDVLDDSWASYATMLERAHEHAPRLNQTSAIDHDHGVRVDRVQTLKNEQFRAVFLVSVIDSEYPGSPSLSRLFPEERVRRMPDYPGVTHVEPAEVKATFPTESTSSTDPFTRYYAEHARRRLAIGAAAATDRLYFCLHTHQDTALEERVQPSRILVSAYRTLPWLADGDDPEIAGEREAETYLLARVDHGLSELKRTHSQDVTVSIDDLEAELSDVQRLLDRSGERGEQLREALRARIDLTEGVVRRE